MTDLDITTCLAVGAVLMCASALQGAVGFAAGLFAIPLLMYLADMGLPAAVMTTMLASLAQNLGGIYHLREDVDFRAARWPILVRLAALPLGLIAMAYAIALPGDYVKAVIGAVIVLLLITQGVLGRSSLEHREGKLHPAWMPVAFGSSGFLLGFCGMGGPPMVLWVMAQPWTSKKSRAFLFVLFTSSLPIHCLYLWWKYGEEIHIAAAMALLAIPWIIAGTWVGLWVGSHLRKSRLRAIAYVILLIIAAVAICSPFI